MFERRFREELQKLSPPKERIGDRSEVVWAIGFPAWRSIFTGLTLLCHARGYKLPDFELFFTNCQKCFAAHRKGEEFSKAFEPPLREGMRQRAWTWFESGMAETYLYVCLVEAIEDKMKAGLVLYDARADWKLKADLVVILNNRVFRIDSFFGDLEGREAVASRRESIERSERRTRSSPLTSTTANSTI